MSLASSDKAGASARTVDVQGKRTHAFAIRRRCGPDRMFAAQTNAFAPGQSHEPGKSDPRRSVSWLAGHRPTRTFPSGLLREEVCSVAAGFRQHACCARRLQLQGQPQNYSTSERTAFPLPTRSTVLPEAHHQRRDSRSCSAVKSAAAPRTPDLATAEGMECGPSCWAASAGETFARCHN